MTHLRLPPEDRELSSRTGWTRDHWEAVADHWLLTARQHASPSGGLITPPGRPSGAGIRSDGIEGFARSFLIAAPLLAGSPEDPHDHAGWYARGLAAAMEPGGPDHWGRAIGVNEIRQWNGTPQPIVEAANLAFGLALSRERVWDRLDGKLRDQLADWLAHHATKHGSDNNWLLFTAVIEAFVRSVGYDVPGGHAQPDVDRPNPGTSATAGTTTARSARRPATATAWTTTTRGSSRRSCGSGTSSPSSRTSGASFSCPAR